jgi:AcrR family transcriptional regulator
MAQETRVGTQDRREQDRARRRQDLLLAARNVFAENGFRRATVDEIARRAEVAKGTIYLYFETKEAILAELVLQALAELSAELERANDGCSVLHPDEKLRAMAGAYLAFAQRSPDYYRLINAFDHGDFEEGVSGERRQQILIESTRTLDLVSQAIADGMALGLFVRGEPRHAAGVIWASLNGALALASHPIRRQVVDADAEQLYRATLELCLKGLTADYGG